MRRIVPRRALAGLLVALSGSFAFAGLGGGSGRDAVATISERELVRPGALTACTDATRPPAEYRAADGVLRGFEVDLMAEIASRLDLEADWVDTERAELVDALTAGRCDAVASTLAIRRDRGGALGTIAATAYLSVPLSLLVRRDERSAAVAGLCGRSAGVFGRTHEHELLGELAAACAEQGRPPIEIVAQSTTPEALDALRAGRIDAILAEHPVNAWYAQRQTDRFDLAAILGEEVVRWAIGIDPDRTAAYDAIHVALRALHEDGTFRELVEQWGLDRAGAVALPTT